jgi:hypothetical protein
VIAAVSAYWRIYGAIIYIRVKVYGVGTARLEARDVADRPTCVQTSYVRLSNRKPLEARIVEFWRSETQIEG